MKVLLVEDDLMLADGLSRYLAGEGMGVEVVRTGSEADVVLQHASFQAMVLDIELPALGGLTVLRRLRARGSTMPVVLLTGDVVEERVAGMELGADEYMVKPFEPVELVARIRAALRRESHLTTQLEAGGLVMDLTAKRVSINGRHLELSAREWAVTEYLLRNPGRVVSKEQISAAILRGREGTRTNAVEVYVSRVRAKIVGARIQIRTIRGFGYLLERAELAAAPANVVVMADAVGVEVENESRFLHDSRHALRGD